MELSSLWSAAFCCLRPWYITSRLLAALNSSMNLSSAEVYPLLDFVIFSNLESSPSDDTKYSFIVSSTEKTSSEMLRSFSRKLLQLATNLCTTLENLFDELPAPPAPGLCLSIGSLLLAEPLIVAELFLLLLSIGDDLEFRRMDLGLNCLWSVVVVVEDITSFMCE